MVAVLANHFLGNPRQGCKSHCQIACKSPAFRFDMGASSSSSFDFSCIFLGFFSVFSVLFFYIILYSDT